MLKVWIFEQILLKVFIGMKLDFKEGEKKKQKS